MNPSYTTITATRRFSTGGSPYQARSPNAPVCRVSFRQSPEISPLNTIHPPPTLVRMQADPTSTRIPPNDVIHQLAPLPFSSCEVPVQPHVQFRRSDGVLYTSPRNQAKVHFMGSEGTIVSPTNGIVRHPTPYMPAHVHFMGSEETLESPVNNIIRNATPYFHYQEKKTVSPTNITHEMTMERDIYTPRSASDETHYRRSIASQLSQRRNSMPLSPMQYSETVETHAVYEPTADEPINQEPRVEVVVAGQPVREVQPLQLEPTVEVVVAGQPVREVQPLQLLPPFLKIVAEPETLWKLIQNKIDVNMVDDNDYTMLMTAARHGHLEAVNLLLGNGAHPDFTGPETFSARDQPTPLTLASKHGHLSICDALIQAHANVNKTDARNYSPLMYASANGQINVVRLLLHHGANPRYQARPNPRMPRRRSSVTTVADRRMSGVAIANKLLLDQHDCAGGKTALICAARYGHAVAVGLLLEYNTPVESTDDMGRTALYIATTHSHIPVVRALLRNGAHVDSPDHEGTSPLMWAVRLSDHTVARLLLEHGANVNYWGGSSSHDYSRTPLSWALQYSDAKMVEILRSHGGTIRTGVAPPEACCICSWF